jgi:hypothetical protein
MPLYGFNQRRGQILARMADKAGGLANSSLTYPAIGTVGIGGVVFINASGAEIPAYALMRVTTPTTVGDEMIVNVAKPDATFRWQYLVNGPDTVENSATARGLGTWLYETERILYDTSSTPAFDQHWGPKSGEWKLYQHRPGFVVDGRYDATNGFLWGRQLPPGEVRIKNDDGSGTLAAGASRTFGIYGGAAGTTDTGLEVTHTNGSSVAWATDKYGWATADAGGLILSAPHQT